MSEFRRRLLIEASKNSGDITLTTYLSNFVYDGSNTFNVNTDLTWGKSN